MYSRSNMFFTLSFIHLVSSMLVSYNIYMNRLLFENEDSIIFCKQSVSFLCPVCENYFILDFFALRLLFRFQSETKDHFVPTVPMLTLQCAFSVTGRARLRHVASQVLRTIWRKPECVLICQNLTNRNAHALHGRFCCLDPGGYLLSRVHSSQSSRCCAYACIARCSLGLRLASSPTGRARLRPLQVKCLMILNGMPLVFPHNPSRERECGQSMGDRKTERPLVSGRSVFLSPIDHPLSRTRVGLCGNTSGIPFRIIKHLTCKGRRRARPVGEEASRKPSEQRVMQAYAQQRDDCELQYLLSAPGSQ